MTFWRRWMGKMRRYARDEAGLAAVEFSFIAPVFLVLFLGFYVFGMYFVTLNRLQFGAETAARYAAVHEDATTADLEDIIIDSLSVVSGDPAQLTVSTATETSNGINFVELNADYAFNWNLPLVPSSMNMMTLSVTSRIAVE